MKAMPDGRLIPTARDTIAFDDGKTVPIIICVRRFACARKTADETRYGCYLVLGEKIDGEGEEEYIVTADVSGRYSRTFRPCSNA